MNIAVIGAGISGMSSALKLVEAGHTVSVMAKNFSPNITSNRAAAFWLPYHVRNDRRGINWCRRSYETYKELANDPSTGISMKTLIKVVADDVPEVDRTWKDFMPAGSYRPIPKEKLLPGYTEGDEAEVPLIETQIFLPWLQMQLELKGVTFQQRTISSLDEVQGFDLIINCSGLGAKSLCNDEKLVPYRGQVALLSPKEGLPIFLDNEKPQYIVPRKDAIIIGGTYEENIWDENTEPKTIEFLLQKAFNIYPELKEQEYLGSWAGLRPHRNDVRLEREGNIIHNYGHGGSGFTLAFGCAEDVLKLVTDDQNSERTSE
jgi:D-amino-acid oxidase